MTRPRPAEASTFGAVPVLHYSNLAANVSDGVNRVISSADLLTAPHERTYRAVIGLSQNGMDRPCSCP
jgi:hypothetical protein